MQTLRPVRLITYDRKEEKKRRDGRKKREDRPSPKERGGKTKRKLAYDASDNSLSTLPLPFQFSLPTMCAIRLDSALRCGFINVSLVEYVSNRWFAEAHKSEMRNYVYLTFSALIMHETSLINSTASVYQCERDLYHALYHVLCCNAIPESKQFLHTWWEFADGSRISKNRELNGQ